MNSYVITCVGYDTLRCTGLRAFGRVADADLAVMAMSAEDGWALTLHGLWLFDRQPDEPEPLDPDA
ncbi:MAG: hypothetical protein MUC96_31890, partial [Myxococcaceae bacterium]|nr:hypothetical protein [Myxococcaceae bacterium]